MEVKQPGQSCRQSLLKNTPEWDKSQKKGESSYGWRGGWLVKPWFLEIWLFFLIPEVTDSHRTSAMLASAETSGMSKPGFTFRGADTLCGGRAINK